MDQITYLQKKQQFIGADPLIKPITLSQIGLTNESLIKHKIIVDNTPIHVSDSFFTDLSGILKIDRLYKETHKHEDFDFGQVLMKGVKDYKQRVGDTTDYYLIAGQQSKIVQSIVPSNSYNRLSNESIFKLSEMILNSDSNLELSNVTGSDYGVRIQFMNSQEFSYLNIGPDEAFKFGIGLNNIGYTSTFEDYVYRLVCSNGMIAKSNSREYKIGNSKDAIANALVYMDLRKETGYIPARFIENLERATSVTASLGEVMSFTNTLKKQFDKDDDISMNMYSQLVDEFVPTLSQTHAKLLLAGYIPDALTDAQLKFVKTNISVWDLINSMTWLGSHDTPYGLSSHFKETLQSNAGILFGTSKQYDLQSLQLLNI